MTTCEAGSIFATMTVLKLLLVLALIVYGIKRKIFVGYLLFGAGILIPLLFGHSLLEVAEGIRGTLTASAFWRLFAAIVIVTILGRLLRLVGALDRLTSAAQTLAGGKRTATAVLPAAIGLMPMPGGALLSAPMVEKVLKDENKSPQFMSAANYWFRHVMEFFWPLYPGIILAAGIAGIEIRTFSLIGLVMSIAMVGIGYLFFLRRISNQHHQTRSIKSILNIILAIWPLFLAVFMTLFLHLDILIALIIAIGSTVAAHRSGWKALWPAIREAVTFRLFLMVFGILVFKDLLELSGAVADIPREVARYGIPAEAIIFVVAFLSGLLSGMVAAFVGLSFPILAGFLYLPQLNLGNLFLAYLSGYLGMILSPTHFCLLLTSEHFKAELGRVYRSFIVPLLLLALVGLIFYFLGYPWNIFRTG